MLKVHARMVIETDPDVKKMANEIKYITGRSIKEIIETLIRQEYQKVVFPHKSLSDRAQEGGYLWNQKMIFN
jgi:hypothetical protein